MPQNETQDAVLKKEEQILKEEKQILRTEKRMFVMILVVFGAIIAAGIGLMYYSYASKHISIDKSMITAPLVTLGATAPGDLQSVSVHEGDQILPNTVVAQVGTEVIKSKKGGLVVAVVNDIGKRFNPGEAIVTLIDPGELRVVGSVDENKGLQDIQVGQQAVFTVDAFGSRKFYGTVDSISPTSEASGIVFNISDKRETKVFDVKVRYDIAQYPELKNGMSAKITITR